MISRLSGYVTPERRAAQQYNQVYCASLYAATLNLQFSAIISVLLLVYSWFKNKQTNKAFFIAFTFVDFKLQTPVVVATALQNLIYSTRCHLQDRCILGCRADHWVGFAQAHAAVS